jgi:hypothetical protein
MTNQQTRARAPLGPVRAAVYLPSLPRTPSPLLSVSCRKRTDRATGGRWPRADVRIESRSEPRATLTDQRPRGLRTRLHDFPRLSVSSEELLYCAGARKREYQTLDGVGPRRSGGGGGGGGGGSGGGGGGGGGGSSSGSSSYECGGGGFTFPSSLAFARPRSRSFLFVSLFQSSAALPRPLAPLSVTPSAAPPSSLALFVSFSAHTHTPAPILTHGRAPALRARSRG